MDELVKTTVILDDDLYEELVREALRRYGSTRRLSRLINEILREGLHGVRERGGWGRLTVKLGKPRSPEDVERLAEEGWGETVDWRR